MERTQRSNAAEQRFLLLLRDAGLPEPDEIEYGKNEMRFLWTDRKVAVVIDFDEAENTQIVPA
jgi:hypothetical protein